MTPGKTCETCAAFSALTSDCRRHAPTVLMVQQKNGEPARMGVFPATQSGGWCAEWLDDESKGVMQ